LALRWKLIEIGELLENIKIKAEENLGYYELKKHTPWFDEGCLKLLDQRKQAALQSLPDPRK
jgi:hypothetical protein